METIHGWRLDIDTWPDTNRKKWKGLRDIFHESPDGRYEKRIGVGYQYSTFPPYIYFNPDFCGGKSISSHEALRAFCVFLLGITDIKSSLEK
jgi:hypothetical protein